MINFKGLFKLRKEKANEIQLEIDLVNQNKNAISTLFKTVSFEMDSLGEENAFYYLKAISDLSRSIDKELQSNKDIKTIKEIEDFNRIIIDLLKDIVQFFIAVDNYNSQDKDNKVANDIILFKTNINDGFKNIGQFDIKIKDYFWKKNSSIALKEYCLKVIKESFYFLNNRLYIEIEKCPIQSDYENLLYKLEHSINSEDIESAVLLLSNSKKRNVKFNDENDFVDFINNINDKIAFAQELKETFNSEIGIDFKIMTELLKDNKIFRISDRKFRLFHELATVHFDRNIGSYSGVNDKYKHTDSDKKAHSSTIRNISKKLQPLIDKYKINK
jgi:hypothetical protein